MIQFSILSAVLGGPPLGPAVLHEAGGLRPGLRGQDPRPRPHVRRLERGAACAVGLRQDPAPRHHHQGLRPHGESESRDVLET